MSHAAPAWPVKTREFHNHHFDSTVWNALAFRDDDIVVSTYAKSGTTWTQQIVAQLVFNGDPTVSVGMMSPWVDLRVPPREVKIAALEAQQHRRILKTHLPVDALVYSPKAKYIYVARDGRDVVWSMYNHHKNGNAAYYDVLNNTPNRVGPPILPPKDDVRAYFNDWLGGNGEPWWPFWENVRTWWALRGLPNLHIVHFNDLKRDLPGEMRRIAQFLDIAIDESRWPTIVEHCTFDWMKRHASQAAPMGGALWEGGGETFINKGSNGRWQETLTAEDCARYERRAVEELGEACARWLKHGSMPVGLPAANDAGALTTAA